MLDVTIVAVALPAVQDDLGFSTGALQWVVTAYVAMFGGFLILAGRAGDLFGRRRLFVAGLILFAAASLGCGLAPSPGALVALRALQGLGAALVAPTALALLTATFPAEDERRRAVAAWTAAAAGGGAIGWVLGGVLVETAGWRWIFYVNVPIGLLAALLAPRLLAESRDGRRRGLDVPGALTLTGGVMLLVLGVEREAWPALAGAVVLLAAFVGIERRVADPLFPLGTLRVPAFATSTGAAMALTSTTSPAMLLAVLHLQRSEGLSAAATGLACAPLSVAVIAGSALGPAVMARAGTGAAMAGGLAAIAAGTGVLVAAGGLASMIPAFVAMGFGLGCASVASTSAGTAALGAEHGGLASGALNAAAEIGTVLGVGILVVVAERAGFGWAYAAAALVAVVAATASAPPSRTRPPCASSPRSRSEPPRAASRA